MSAPRNLERDVYAIVELLGELASCKHDACDTYASPKHSQIVIICRACGAVHEQGTHGNAWRLPRTVELLMLCGAAPLSELGVSIVEALRGRAPSAPATTAGDKVVSEALRREPARVPWMVTLASTGEELGIVWARWEEEALGLGVREAAKTGRTPEALRVERAFAIAGGADLSPLRDALEPLSLVAGGREPLALEYSREDVAKAMRELERLGFVARTEGGAEVAPELLQALKRRDDAAGDVERILSRRPPRARRERAEAQARALGDDEQRERLTSTALGALLGSAARVESELSPERRADPRLGEPPAVGTVFTNPRGRRFRVISVEGLRARVVCVETGQEEGMDWPIAREQRWREALPGEEVPS